jgi:hypothetical protein
MLRSFCLSLAGAAFQRCAGSVRPTNPQRINTSPEPETRNGLSLARNDAFAPLRGLRSRPASSNPCQKRSPTRSISGSSAPPRFRKPAQGEINALDPLSGPAPGPLAISAGLHSPSGLLNLPDRSVRPVPSQEARLAKRPTAFCSPPRFLSIRRRINARDPFRSVWLHRPVNPGTESIIRRATPFRQTENSPF